MTLLVPRDPMGIYQILFAFASQTGSYIGDPGTRPMSQGFPLTTPVPGGPALPAAIEVTATDRMYPKADGTPALRRAIAEYYNTYYGSKLTDANVMVFAGGRPALVALLWMLAEDLCVSIEETEYTPYWDMLRHCARDYVVVPSNEENRFRPSLDTHRAAHARDGKGRQLLLRSNPCNPTGVELQAADLDQLGSWTRESNFAAIIDEAYEFFCDPEPRSVLAHVKDIDEHNLFVVGAATKGLQSPGARTGWVVGPAREIEVLRNYSSYGMGGVSQLSQNYVLRLFEAEHIATARSAIAKFYNEQRKRYCAALVELGCEDFTGNGGFYSWVKLPGGMTAAECNRRLFEQKAAILPGELCDMHRRREASPLARFIRVSFGPRKPEDFDGDIAALRNALAG
ncbi:MAG: pyridoxal phosphate-dependent aminotransferase [Planctomycetes bacterium]|nr:pyridoxal phosphate-dependent aminotransferase [Planctomycetota bacterium]MCB9920488.1 pyridoxal phosphate-dependent aminotransferase [Planctomycetota bacterium]